jgi:type II secretory pathway component GspD/PulD (secretin)
VVGGLTDTAATYNNNGVAGLGSMPGPFGKLFKRDGTASRKKELIILLRPQIISL